MNHNELNALQYIVMSMERIKTIARVIMNQMLAINIAVDYVNGED